MLSIIPIYQLGLAIAHEFGFDPNLVQPSSLAKYLKTPNARPYAKNLTISNQKFINDYNFTPRTLTQGLVEIKRQLLG